MKQGGKRKGAGRKPNAAKKVRVWATVKEQTKTNLNAIAEEDGGTIGQILDDEFGASGE